MKKLVRVSGGNYTSTTYIDGIFELLTDGTDIQNTLHVMDDKSRIATIRLGYDFGDTTPAVKYVLEDHLGNSTREINGDGTFISKEEYYPFGETSFASYGKKRYKYNGKERDEESGMYNYGMRYYSAWTCRFVSVDPLRWKYPFYSSYQSTGNSPISFIDADGLERADPESREPIGQQGKDWGRAEQQTHSAHSSNYPIGPIFKSTGAVARQNGLPIIYYWQKIPEMVVMEPKPVQLLSNNLTNRSLETIPLHPTFTFLKREPAVTETPSTVGFPIRPPKAAQRHAEPTHNLSKPISFSDGLGFVHSTGWLGPDARSINDASKPAVLGELGRDMKHWLDSVAAAISTDPEITDVSVSVVAPIGESANGGERVFAAYSASVGAANIAAYLQSKIPENVTVHPASSQVSTGSSNIGTTISTNKSK